MSTPYDSLKQVLRPEAEEGVHSRKMNTNKCSQPWLTLQLEGETQTVP